MNVIIVTSQMEKPNKCKTNLSHSQLPAVLQSYSGTREVEGHTGSISPYCSFYITTQQKPYVTRALGCWYLSFSMTPSPLRIPFILHLLSCLFPSLSCDTEASQISLIYRQQDLCWALHLCLSICEIASSHRNYMNGNST